jgi:hypothetical protein
MESSPKQLLASQPKSLSNVSGNLERPKLKKANVKKALAKNEWQKETARNCEPFL